MNNGNGMDRRVFVHAGEFVLRSVGGEGVLVPIRNRVGDLDPDFVMTPVAMRIWALIDGNRNIDAIVASIEDEYDVEADVAERDVKELVSAMEDAKLIRLA